MQPSTSLKIEKPIMGMNKITYSGSSCNNYVYFALDGDFFDVKDISTSLAIVPTLTRIKKDPVPKKTSWQYKIEAGNDPDVLSALTKLIDLFEPKLNTIIELKKKFNLKSRLQFVLDIDIDPNATTPYFPFDARTIGFLYKTSSTVDFDIYKSDTLGLINEDAKFKNN